MQKELDLKSGYEKFKTFQASVGYEKTNQIRPYELTPCKVQFYQPNLPYREGKQAERNVSYSDHGQESY